MKQAAEILCEVAQKVVGKLRPSEYELVLSAMQSYASQAVDECANQSYKTIIGNEVVNKDSILSVKTKLR